MPRGSSSRGSTVYSPIKPPPQQQHFPHRRRSVRTNPKPPTVSKRQSTLTQIDFVSTPPVQQKIIGLSDDDDDEEYQQTRPAKRRKRASDDNRTDSQPSLTQWDRTASRTRNKRSAPDVEDFEIWEDSPRKTTMSTGCATRQRRAANELETAASTRRSPRRNAKRDSPASSAVDDQTARAHVNVDAKPLRTPRKRHVVEIPSSQSPPSGKLSTQRSVRFRDAERSPLKERSVNARGTSPSKRSPESQPVAMKMLQKVYLENVARRKNASTAPRVSEEASEKGLEPAASSVARPQRVLKRTTTVQDSQYEDWESDLDEVDAGSPGRVEDEQAANEEHHEYVNDDDDLEQNTYDPAHSALDRDATRFLQTQLQTQGCYLTPHVSNSTCSAEEITASDDEFEVTVVPLSPGLGEDPAKQLSQELRKAVQGVCSRPAEPQQHMDSDADSERMQSLQEVAGRGNQEQPDDVVVVPSSSPPLRPSQISTVVPTQRSPLRPSSRGEIDTIPTSPYKAADSFAWPPETLSSSPLPLPPWSSPERILRVGKEHVSVARHGRRGSEQLQTDDTLVDFSLPPPPPMSSSSKVSSSPLR